METQAFALQSGMPLGTVYGALLNDRATLTRLAPQFDSPPYKAAPKAPVLYIKPRNTWARSGAAVAVPADPGVVRLDATLGLVMGRAATQVAPAQAMDYVAGYVIVSDITLPHENYYRPAIVQRCRDGFCPMGDLLQPLPGFDVNTARLQLALNGRPVYERSFADLVRPASQLIADVTEFMTLAAGDVLLLGPGEGAPQARPGDEVRIEVAGLGALHHSLVLEELA
ncbi:fumarylacetoacetate hydrolase family protein [Comamonas composti]|uniref:fumarylacetoacetate hydrolase family protein n=1 Tax=Comamonas composti TaxID=408558 RepID=UPI0004132DDB|nr:fumarylacetoacetate hydrolase family protein [Comamonas composti]